MPGQLLLRAVLLILPPLFSPGKCQFLARWGGGAASSLTMSSTVWVHGTDGQLRQRVQQANIYCQDGRCEQETKHSVQSVWSLFLRALLGSHEVVAADDPVDLQPSSPMVGPDEPRLVKDLRDRRFRQRTIAEADHPEVRDVADQDMDHERLESGGIYLCLAVVMPACYLVAQMFRGHSSVSAKELEQLWIRNPLLSGPLASIPEESAHDLAEEADLSAREIEAQPEDVGNRAVRRDVEHLPGRMLVKLETQCVQHYLHSLYERVAA